MTTTRSKRWNGKLETLAAVYLNKVIAQMDAYGDRVQFALTTPGPRPNYQVINNADKKMAFDSSHHLLQAQAAEFSDANATEILTLDQIKAVGAGKSGSAKRAAPRAGARISAATVKATDLVDAAKYDYFKTNRQALPAAIGSHSDEITTMMRNGISAEEAFAEVVKRHFK